MMRRRCAAPLLALLLAAAGLPAGAGSQLFKCVDGGRTVYQQQACSPTATTEPPASADRAASAQAASPPAGRKLKPVSASASAASATRR